MSVDMPICSNETYGSLKNASGQPHTTYSYALADMRFTVQKSLFKDDVSRRGNIQFGLGIKFPTGNYHTEDYFYFSPSDPSFREIAPVNVTIQLGDGVQESLPR
jgi:hypothetical protein